MKLRYDKIYDSLDSKEELIQIFRNNESIALEIPFDSINVTNSNLDIMMDYIEVSFISEGIAKFSEIINYGNAVRDKYYLSFIVSFKPKQIQKLANFIYRNSKSCSKKNEFDESELFEYRENIVEYESQLENVEFYFPDLIDSYYANLVNAGYFEIAADFTDDEDKYLEEEFKKYPERKFGFWKSAASKKLKSNFFVSTDSWIIPINYNVIKILSEYSGIERKYKIGKAEKFEFKGKTLFTNQYCAVWHNVKSELSKARNCAINTLGRFMAFDAPKTTTYLLSEFGDVLIVKDSFFYFVFYLSNAKLNFKELTAIRDELNPTYENVSCIMGLSEEIKLDWSTFDDEKFEQLCYDILYVHPKFDNSTIRKMGKSRSRDGGRDITIWTRSVSGKDPELFIFQCKFYKPKSSLSASKIGDAGNTIMQYGAKGYGVFTTGVIDATLYDMLDGFAANYNISTRENWSVFEIERFVIRNKVLIKRYFN
ncbi:hypothetical protein DF185_04205 [Marinifilum breve]|uniref:Restriction endonuclease type IV Mrr domain-containing protein n=1 Tax=Marinifilum breve TaxID=2184082 RepID=A0A2V4A3E0_9BACT|nr:restriction endonuclease [Marinifilum breve]PXY01860.1 hypothetical protein DF185_04205 [Marinifilum breve]